MRTRAEAAKLRLVIEGRNSRVAGGAFVELDRAASAKRQTIVDILQYYEWGGMLPKRINGDPTGEILDDVKAWANGNPSSLDAYTQPYVDSVETLAAWLDSILGAGVSITFSRSADKFTTVKYDNGERDLSVNSPPSWRMVDVLEVFADELGKATEEA